MSMLCDILTQTQHNQTMIGYFLPFATIQMTQEKICLIVIFTQYPFVHFFSVINFLSFINQIDWYINFRKLIDISIFITCLCIYK